MNKQDVQIMPIRIKSLISILSIALWSTAAQSSKYIKLNPSAITAYEQLDSMFPLRFLRYEDMTSGYYWVTLHFQTRQEAENVKDKLSEIGERLRNEPAFHQYTETKDSMGSYRFSVVTKLKTEMIRQDDYLEFSFDNRGVRFYYRSHLPGIDWELTPEQAVADSMEDFMSKYTDKHGIIKRQLTFRPSTNYNFYTFSPPDNADTATGTLYIIPNCTQQDYLIFKNLVYKFSRKHNVFTSSNDVYGLYEECAIMSLRNDNTALAVAAALKGSQLHIIVVDGNKTDRKDVFLPRAWAEPDLVWHKERYM